MKRRLILVLSTLAALLAAIGVYWLVAGLESGPGRRDDLPPRRPRRKTGIGGQTGPLDKVLDVEIVARDKYGRLEGIYRAKRWDRRDDGSHLLTEPRVELFRRSGQRTVLIAEQAVVYGEELDRGISIRRATLHGDVTIYFDPATDPDRAPIQQRLDEVVRVHVEDVEFDNEHLAIHTDKRVTVFSPEADIYGRGLSISWNESPRELRILRIAHGEYMAVYNVPEELDMVALPGAERREGAATRPSTQPATRPSTQPATRPSTQPATQPTTAASAPAEPKPRNQYVAEFHENVKVVHRGRMLYGADVLALSFDWDTAWREGETRPYLTPRRRRRRRTGAAAATAPTSAPGTAPASAPGTAPASAPASRPTDEPASEPMEVFWSGPLVLRPTGRTETPSRRRYEVTASGPQVVLSDPRATAACGEFLFRYPQRAGHLKGAGETPVRLVLGEGADVICRQIRFRPDTGFAYLDGAGHMARRFEEGLPQARAIELIETEEPDRPPEGDRITWGRNVVLRFSERRVRRGDGSPATRQFIDHADFHENVVLRQGDDANADFVQCDLLRVHMARGRHTSAYPREAVATGNVKARQEGTDLSARAVTVRFVERAPGAAPGRGDFGRVQPAFLLADGDVRLSDRRDPNGDPLEASADRVESDLIQRTAVLAGTPARIAQGPNRLVGPVIRLDQREGAAVAEGTGELHFLSSRDINGNRLAKPRPVRVAWTKGMAFQGERRTGSFRGDVALDSGKDQVRCQNMELIFTKAEPASRPATRPASRPATRPASRPSTRPGRSRRRDRLAVDMERYSRRKISMILADKDVALRSRREDEKGRLLRRIQLAGDRLIYDADWARMTMLGHGTFVAEDYGKPKPRKAAGTTGVVAAVGRPSQTAFQWHKSMQFSQDKRLVILHGDVQMVHKSGREIILTDQLNVPRDTWGELTEGRRTILACDEMLAQFGEPAKASTTQPTQPARDVLQEGPNLGPLEIFRATKNVNLKDGPRQVLAQRLFYSRLTDVAIIHGYLEGHPPAKATVLYEDPQAGRSQSWSSPKITWYRRDNRIVTHDVTGAGSR